MTVDYIRRVHQVMEVCGGKVDAAAVALRISVKDLNAIIEDHPELKSYSDGVEPPSEIEAISREPLVPSTVDGSETAIVAAMKEAEKSLESGLSSIGVKPGSIKQVVAFHQFGALHFKSMRHLIGGGIVKLYTDLFSEREELLDDIRKIAGADNDRERLLREDLGRINEAIIKVYDRCLAAWQIQAKLDAAKAAAKESNKKKGGPPGFAPLAMNVQGNVVIQDKK
jgi:hypothetical protein